MLRLRDLLSLGLIIIMSASSAAAEACEGIDWTVPLASMNDDRFLACLDAEIQKQDPKLSLKDPEGMTVLHRLAGSMIGADWVDYSLEKISDEDVETVWAAQNKAGKAAVELAFDNVDNPAMLTNALLWNQWLTLDFEPILRRHMQRSESDGLTHTNLAQMIIAGEWYEDAVDSAHSTHQRTASLLVGHPMPKLDLGTIALEPGATCPNTDDDLSQDEVHSCLWEAFDPENPLISDKDGFTILHAAIFDGAGPKAIDHLLYSMSEEDRATILKMRTRDGLSALDLAAAVGQDPRVIPHLVAWGADVNAGFPNTDSGWFRRLPGRALPPARRPLHYAAMRTDDLRFAAMAHLLAMGADVTAQDRTSAHPHAQDLLDLVSDCEAPNVGTGNTAGHLVLRVRACVEWADQEQIDSLLLVMHATKSLFGMRELTVGLFSDKVRQVPNAKGATPLHFAASIPETNLFTIDQLLRIGADTDLKDEDGWTPLLLYAGGGTDPDAFALLLEVSQTACDQRIEGGTLASLLKRNVSLKDAETRDGNFLHNLIEARCPR